MGNLYIRKLTRPTRLFASKKSDHRHDYSLRILVELNRLDNSGKIYSKTYYNGRKCKYCRAMLVDNYIREPNWSLQVVRLKTRHTHLINLTDIELM